MNKEEVKFDALKVWYKDRGHRLQDEVSTYKSAINFAINLMHNLRPNVEVYFDKEQRIIALKPVEEKTSNSFRIAEYERKDRAVESPRMNCRELLTELKVKKSKYPATWNSEHHLLVFHYELNEE